MPTYEYVCRSCGHLFEVVQSMRDDPLTECPQCGGELRKVFAPPAISFKGSGFYATDHGTKAPAKDDDRTKADAPAKDAKDSKDTKGTSSGGSKEAGGKDRPAPSAAPATKDATGS